MFDAQWFIRRCALRRHAVISCTLGIALGCGCMRTSRGAEKPLWEVGIGVGLLAFDDYRGSDSAHSYPIPIPYVVYRGKFFKADHEGMRGQVFNNDRLDLTLSLNATTPVSSRDSDARVGMPDLKPTFELGPELDVHLWRSADDRLRLTLQLPARRSMTLAANPRAVGWLFAPSLDLDVEHVAGQAGWIAGIQAGPLFADRDYLRYFYAVAANFATASRPAYEPAGGYSGAELLLGTSRRFKRFWVFAFARHDSLAGADFLASPLVRSRNYWFGGVGFAWLIGKSSRQVEARD